MLCWNMCLVILVLSRGQTKRVLAVHLDLVVTDQVEFLPVIRMAIAASLALHCSTKTVRARGKPTSQPLAVLVGS